MMRSSFFVKLLTFYYLRQETNMSQFIQLMTEDFVKEAIQNPNKPYYCPELHAGNCNLKALSQFTEGCKNVSKMYLIVHLFPMILKRKKVK